ncbi:unnamed protein product [Mucor fragilis]
MIYNSNGTMSVLLTRPKASEPDNADKQDVPSAEDGHDDDETLAKLNDTKTALEKLLLDTTKELHQFFVENGSV